MSQIADILKAALETAKRENIKRVWHEPIGRGAEMQGPSGGWMFEDDNGEDCLGLTAEDAIKHIVVIARLRAYADYDAAHHRRTTVTAGTP